MNLAKLSITGLLKIATEPRMPNKDRNDAILELAHRADRAEALVAKIENEWGDPDLVAWIKASQSHLGEWAEAARKAGR